MMKKLVGLTLATGLAFSAIAPVTVLHDTQIAQAATIQDGEYNVQVALYYNGNISENAQGNMSATALYKKSGATETVTITLYSADSYKDLYDASGKELTKVTKDGKTTVTLTGKDIITKGIGITYHVVVPEINYDHLYDMVLKFDEKSLISTAASKTTRTLKATVQNKVRANDKVKVTGMKKGDTVRLYKGTTVISKKVATSTAVTFSVAQLGKKAGNVKVTAQAKGEAESKAQSFAYKAEAVAAKVAAKNIQVTNKKGSKNDVTVVKGIKKGDTVRIYDYLGNLIGKGVAKKSSVSIKTRDLSKKGGNVYVTRSQKGKNPSSKVKKAYKAEK